jgi:hypothetical protein
MGNLSFERTEVDERNVDWLVIPFDRPVQAGACSIVGLALISIGPATYVIPGASPSRGEPGISGFPDLQLNSQGMAVRTIRE